MKQFEYKFVEPGFKTFFKGGDDRMTEEYGKHGWELVTVAGGKLVFKREIGGK
ncbi:hypothetical protein CHOTACABRAS_134 [Bacillus phage Chotacabras]|nr:hypothetical protein CHOTACABRAS_134 [Bacillus phage Chotacabras]